MRKQLESDFYYFKTFYYFSTFNCFLLANLELSAKLTLAQGFKRDGKGFCVVSKVLNMDVVTPLNWCEVYIFSNDSLEIFRFAISCCDVKMWEIG